MEQRKKSELGWIDFARMDTRRKTAQAHYAEGISYKRSHTLQLVEQNRMNEYFPKYAAAIRMENRIYLVPAGIQLFYNIHGTSVESVNNNSTKTVKKSLDRCVNPLLGRRTGTSFFVE
jgi:hypothetical protein